MGILKEIIDYNPSLKNDLIRICWYKKIRNEFEYFNFKRICHFNKKSIKNTNNKLCLSDKNIRLNRVFFDEEEPVIRCIKDCMVVEEKNLNGNLEYKCYSKQTNLHNIITE